MKAPSFSLLTFLLTITLCIASPGASQNALFAIYLDDDSIDIDCSGCDIELMEAFNINVHSQGSLSGNEAKAITRFFCTDKEWSMFWKTYNSLHIREKADKSPLHYALEVNGNNVAKELVYVYGYEAFPDLIWCLCKSISNDFDELPLLMIDKGLDPSFDNSLLLSFAAKFGREELLLKLLSLGVDPNGIPKGAWPALNELASNSNRSASHVEEKRQSSLRMAKALIEAGADVNKGSRPGCTNTPLYIACDSCYGPDFEFVKFLLDSGADPNVIEKSSGETPFLHLFWMCERFSSFKWDGRSAMIYKCFWTTDCLECIKLFIPYGIDVNFKNKDGNTALIYLLQKHPGNNKISLEILKILLESGADPLLPGLVPLAPFHRDWLTPMEYACAEGFEQHLKYMIEFSDPWVR